MAQGPPSLYLGDDCHCCNRDKVRVRLKPDLPLKRTVLVCHRCDLSTIVPRPWPNQSPPDLPS
jgi:hypothetical protein